MRIGTLGSGRIGGTVGRLWVGAGHEVCFGTRHPQGLQGFVAHAGPLARSGTPEEAAAFGDVILLAVPLRAVPDLAKLVGPLVEGKVVLDACNPYPQRDGVMAPEALAHPAGSSGWVASHLPTAHVVKAFNTVYFKTLEAEAHRQGDRIGIPLAGDDPDALRTAEGLVRDAGFEPVTIGSLAEGRRIQPGTAVYTSGMSAREVVLALSREASQTAKPQLKAAG